MDPRIERYLSGGDGLDALIGVERNEDRDPLFAAWLVDFPGCIAQGQSETEAVHRLKLLAPSFLEAMLELGVELPQNQRGVIVGFMQFYAEGTSGNLGISEPRRLEMNEPKGSTVPELPTAFTFSPA